MPRPGVKILLPGAVFLSYSRTVYLCIGVAKSLPPPDIRLHLTRYSDQIKVAFPSKGEAATGEGILDERRAGTAAANKDHLRYDFLRIILGNTKVASEVLFHLSCSVAILKEKRISIL